MSGSFGNRRVGLGHRGADRGVRELRRVGPLAAALHVEELVAQRRDAALGEPGGDRRHERMGHAGAGAMREHVTGRAPRRRLQQAGDASVVVDGDGDRLGVMAGMIGFRGLRLQLRPI